MQQWLTKYSGTGNRSAIVADDQGRKMMSHRSERDEIIQGGGIPSVTTRSVIRLLETNNSFRVIKHLEYMDLVLYIGNKCARNP